MSGLKVKWLSIVILAVLIVYGLGAGLMYSLNYELSSDTVVPGLVAQEIFEHGNFQFDFPVNDPYLFTDIYTFHLLPQFLSGYDPTVLRLTAFAMFLILIGVFSYIVYRYAGTVGAMMFAALMANLSPGAYYYFISPEYHVGTLIATGIFIVLLNFDRIKKSSIYWTAACIIAVALVMLSDSMILTLFIIPYIAYYVLFARPRLWESLPKKKSGKKANKVVDNGENSGRKKMDVIVLSVAVIPGLAWLFKTFEPASLGTWMPYFALTPLSLVDLSHAMTVNLPLYFRCITYLVSQSWYDLLGLHVGVLDIPLAIIFLAALGISVKRANKNAGYLCMMFLGSAIASFLGFVFLSLTGGLGSARFLIFTALAIFAVISLGYDEKEEGNKLNLLLLGLVVALVLSTVPLNYSKLISLDGHPNQEEYGLIAFMENKSYTVGYSDYDNANMLTYLSKERLIIRTVQIEDNTLDSYQWLATNKWYVDQPSRFFVLTKTGTAFNGDMLSMAAKHPPQHVDTYGDYNILYFDNANYTS
jgi:hypothetical protein